MYVILFLILLAIDQWSKTWALSSLQPVGIMEVIPGYLNWHYVENTGIAFGMFEGKGWIFILIACIVAAGLTFYGYQHRQALSSLTKFCMTLIVVGAIGNVIDRIRLGFVVDFISVGFNGSFKFAVFNFADMCVVVGCILMMILTLVEEEHG